MDELRKEAINLRQVFRDKIDDSSKPEAHELENAITRIEDDIQSKKPPRSIEDQLKRVIQLLSSGDGKGFMDDRDLDDLKDRCEDMRNQVRKLM